MAPGSVAVIVGSSRGIGLELARIYLGQSKLNVVALSRDADQARKAILNTSSTAPLSVRKGNESEESRRKETTSFDESRLTTIDVDIRDEDSLYEASKKVKSKFGQDSLRLLFNVAGALRVEKNIQQVKYEDLLDQFKINTFAPLLSAKHFSPLLPKNLDVDVEDVAQGLIPKNLSVIANMSARVGSISDNRKGGWYSYRSSKAAQNMITRTMALEMAMRKNAAICVGLHPGTVRTGLSEQFTGGPGGGLKSSGKDESPQERKARGEFEADEAASNLASVIAQLNMDQSGYIWDYAGKHIPF